MIKFYILDQEWQAHKVPSHDPGLYVDGSERVGTTWPMQRCVYLSDELSEQAAMRIIRHELTHAYISATQAISPEGWHEEDVCDLVTIYGEHICATAKRLVETWYNSELDITQLGEVSKHE